MGFAALVEDVLLEFDLGRTIDIYKKKWDNRWKSDPSFPKKGKKEDLDKVQADLNTADPSKSYQRWVIQTYANGGIDRWEDVLARAAGALAVFHKAKIKKKLPPEKADILRIKNLSDLEDLAEEFADAEPTGKDLQRQEMDKAKSESNEIYRDSKVVVVQPNTEFAACFWGRETRWCTAATTHNYYDSYASRGKLLIFIPKSQKRAKEKYQAHLTDQGLKDFDDLYVCDERDSKIEPSELFSRFPAAVVKIFKMKTADVGGGVWMVMDTGKTTSILDSIYVIKGYNDFLGEFFPEANKSRALLLKKLTTNGISEDEANKFIDELVKRKK